MHTPNLQYLKEIFDNPVQKSVIVSHVNPDGDALGSSLGLYHFLKGLKHAHIHVVLPGAFASFLHWMPGSEFIVIGDQEPEKARALIVEADILFCLDFNDLKRTSGLQDFIVESKGKKILIDHHPDPTSAFDWVYSDVRVSSTSELIYCLLEKAGYAHLVDVNIASCLYAGIVTDTGSFSYACNNPKTYEIVSHFMNLGIDGEKIHRLIYDTYSENRVRLLGHCLTEGLKVMSEQKTAYIFLSGNDLKKFDFQEGDTEGVVNYGLSIKDVKLSAIFIEREDGVKISFRSEGDLDVNTLARKYFNGGGHKNAAGGNSKESLQETIQRFENLIVDFSANDFQQL